MVQLVVVELQSVCSLRIVREQLWSIFLPFYTQVQCSAELVDGLVVNPFDAVDALKRSEDRTRYSNF